MNNAKLVMDSISLSEDQEQDRKPLLRSEESRLLKIVNAIQEVQNTKAWSSLKEEIFDSLVNTLEKELRSEAEKIDVDPNKLNRISGELKWARKFSDLQKFENEKMVKLQRVKLQLYGKEQ